MMNLPYIYEAKDHKSLVIFSLAKVINARVNRKPEKHPILRYSMPTIFN